MKSASSTALFAALGLIALGAGAPAAKAADLGGDCCSDLEERVAELEATTARKGNRRVSLTVSGQVTTGVMAWDNGVDSDTYVVDNTIAGGSLFSFTGNAKISPKLTAGFQLSVGLDKGARIHHVDENDDDGGAAGDTSIVVTHANWYLDHKSLGRVTVGRINTASAGATTIDLGGTGVVANSSLGYFNREFSVLVGNFDTGENWGALMGGNTVNASGLSRGNAISYISPTLGGFALSAAWGENDFWDVALRYAGEHHGFRVAAAVAYAHNVAGVGEHTEESGASNNPFGAEPNQWKGSISVLHTGTGLFGTFAYVNQDNDVTDGVLGDRDNSELYYGQVGLRKNWTGLGATSVYGEYAKFVNPLASVGTGSLAAVFGAGGGSPTALLDADTEVYGVGVVQHIDAAAMELFLSYRHYQADVQFLPALGGPTIGVNDFDVVFGGARIKF